MDRLLSRKRTILLFILPTFILLTVIIVIPIFFSLHYSTLKWDGFSKEVFIGFENYKNLFVNNTDGFIQAVINSLVLALISVGDRKSVV